MAENNGFRIAAMLAADAELDALPGGPSFFAGDLNQLADAGLIKGNERVILQETALHVERQEFPGVIPGQPKGGLGQIVGTEGEELSFPGDLVAVRAARGSSIMVPMRYSIFTP